MPSEDQKPEQPTNSESEPPDGGYGWVVVAAVFWNNAHQWGIESVSLAFRLAFHILEEIDKVFSN